MWRWKSRYKLEVVEVVCADCLAIPLVTHKKRHARSALYEQLLGPAYAVEKGFADVHMNARS